MPAWGALFGGLGGGAVFIILWLAASASNEESRRSNGKSASDAYDDFHRMSSHPTDSDGRFR